MNRNKLKTYAPQARRDFIKAVTDRAAFYGLTEEIIEPVTEQGDVAIIAGTPFPRDVAVKRKKLEDRIKRDGFDQVMEAMAYTWFNRFVAIRYMEIHDYLDHGYRVLSNPDDDATPEIVEHAEHVDLIGLDQDKLIELKLDGTKESELYRMLLIAQCNALHKAMPFLFEPIDDETELLVPENLLHSDSLVRKLVDEIPEEDWQEVEIVGWLYQFYISEKKDEVIGKVVRSEDIPAATQLFTPNWIVKYLVQNSLGQQWVATYPDSPVKGQMEYYIEPAEQTPEVQEQLKAITPESLNPEELTLLDPACGSGHILAEAYDLLKSIYQERGYRAKDIPRLILEKNLFGLEIDDRAAQLAAFALLMKARADDRRIFAAGVQPHVLAIQESKGLDAQEITEALNQPLKDGATGIVSQDGVAQLIELFEHGKTYGSLIQVSGSQATRFCSIKRRAEYVIAHGGMLERPMAAALTPIIDQAIILGRTYHAVATNPPYLGARNGMNTNLKQFARSNYPVSKNDLFAVFIERASQFTRLRGHFALITMQSWMFLSSFEGLRRSLLSQTTLSIMAHLGPRTFDTICGEVVTVVAFSVLKYRLHNYGTNFLRLVDGNAEQKRNGLLTRQQLHSVSQERFSVIPGSPIAYWVSDATVECFRSGDLFGDFADTAVGLFTCDNDRFLRCWWEVAYDSIGFGFTSRKSAEQSGKTYFPYNKGGGYRPWYGLNWLVVQFDNDGKDIRVHRHKSGQSYSLPGEAYYFRAGITWSGLTTDINSFRLSNQGYLFESNKGQMAFTKDDELFLGYLNSKCCQNCVGLINPTLSLQSSEIKKLPVLLPNNTFKVRECVRELVAIHKDDWDCSETSWDFVSSPLLGSPQTQKTTGVGFVTFQASTDQSWERVRSLSETVNQSFIDAFGLRGELSPTLPDNEITLYRPDREEDIARLVSYAIGCMMGRYSLDGPGLIYAHSGNQGFDPDGYKTFPADEDGIIPFTDTPWFDDDAANRFVEFISVAWPKEHLEENLKFIAESIGQKKSESPQDAIRRYLSQGFFKHHLSMYKKRPIYWLFSSGKQRAFQCLVYLHRYNEGTLSRMRTEYVIPLQGKIDARIEQLKDDIDAATSTAHGKKLQKERDKLVKQQAELQSFDEKLRHYADQRISLDLDDGVKVNYSKFGDLLAGVKAVTGKKAE